ncbi:hypothetical protein L6452_37060 [Arctium lappa]|uniref:Uncharacterized protein n=1 Tax=Arctium lappa TaxID=4217 RepID=A0ACB8Y2Y7_ARCLA|nr:hypothetical protein L6452_37060 [Arctium lappa]
MLDYGQDSVNIFKTFPTETLGEKSSKGPRCQETKGVAGDSARQKTSTKRSKDPSKVVKTPKGGEDRYTYNELIETIANVNLDVIKHGLEIEEMKKVIISQQTQIVKLKKMVLKLVHQKRRKQFILKKRRSVHVAFKKGESQEKQDEKESTTEMEFQFEGETGADKEEKVGSEAETFENVADIAKAAVTEAAAVTNEPEAETELSREEIETAETLVKAKNDTPKVTQKAKGVMIKEGVLEKKTKEIELDEEVAKKLQEELEKEEEIQSSKDRELTLDMAKKINEEYQKSLKSGAAAKKVTKKASRQRLPLKTRQRQPSKTFLANQERRKMINFLKGALGVPEGMFTNMPYGRIEELYKKEMANLKGNFTHRVEVKQKETLAQKFGAIKRKKSIATKPKAKRPRTEEAEKESEIREDEPPAEQEQNLDQPSQQTQEQTKVQFDLYMTVTDDEPMKVDPISVNALENIHWDMMIDQRKEYFRIKRMGDKYEVYSA